MKNAKKIILVIFPSLFLALALMLRLSSAVNTAFRFAALTLNLLKGFLERSKISFNQSSLKLRQTQSAIALATAGKFRTSANVLFGYFIKYCYITAISFIFINNICAKIVESDRLETVLQYITPGTLVIFDIDNTLAHPVAELSSDEWFCHMVNKKKAEGYDELTSVYYALPVTYYAQFNVDLEPTEIIAADLLADLIAYNISVMALTTRSLFVAERTIEQLEKIDIKFCIPHISPEDLVLPMPLPCFYKNSILFGGNNDKGEVLKAFFHWMNYYPEKVIFIDDKMKYLIAVEKALESYNIEFIGIRYSGCDERVQNFDPKKAEIQWVQLRNKKIDLEV